MGTQTFKAKLYPAMKAKAMWFDGELLPSIVEDYRLLLGLVKSIDEYLIQRGLIIDDPYKFDNKISDIKVLNTEEFLETEKATIIGTRLSEYIGMLSFICNYYKFTVSNLDLTRLSIFSAINSTFMWNNLTPNSPKTNTRALANLITELRSNSNGTMVSSVINDCLVRLKDTLNTINTKFKEVGEFWRELYKERVRKEIVDSVEFSALSIADAKSGFSAIRRLYKSKIKDTQFYADLVTEICEEEWGGNATERQEALLNKLKVKSQKKKGEEVDTRAMIMDAVSILGNLNSTLGVIIEKVRANSDLLENEDKGFLDKLRKFMMKMLKMGEKPLVYDVVINDAVTGAQSSEKLELSKFLSLLSSKSTLYLSFTQKESGAYKKLLEMSENEVNEFLVEQIADCNKLRARIFALDDFFKRNATGDTRSKIKGLQMELTSYKNTTVKANQKRQDHEAYVEEREQMKKLGILDDEG